MASFEFVLPAPPASVTVLTPEEAGYPDISTEGWDLGFRAGFEAGRRNAALEGALHRTAVAEEVGAAIQRLEEVHNDLLKIAAGHLPEIMSVALSRVLHAYKQPIEDLVAEVGALVDELSQATKIEISCAPAELARLQTLLGQLGVGGSSRLEWKGDTTLRQGEFFLRSDMGLVDGRRFVRETALKTAIEGTKVGG